MAEPPDDLWKWITVHKVEILGLISIILVLLSLLSSALLQTRGSVVMGIHSLDWEMTPGTTERRYLPHNSSTPLGAYPPLNGFVEYAFGIRSPPSGGVIVRIAINGVNSSMFVRFELRILRWETAQWSRTAESLSEDPNGLIPLGFLDTKGTGNNTAVAYLRLWSPTSDQVNFLIEALVQVTPRASGTTRFVLTISSI